MYFDLQFPLWANPQLNSLDAVIIFVARLNQPIANTAAEITQWRAACTARGLQVRIVDIRIEQCPTVHEERLSDHLRYIASSYPSVQIRLVFDSIPRHLLLHSPLIMLPQVTEVKIAFHPETCLPPLAELVLRKKVHPELVFHSMHCERPIRLGPRTCET